MAADAVHAAVAFLAKRNNTTFSIEVEVEVRKEREALLVAATRKASRYFRSAIRQQAPPPPNRRRLLSISSRATSRHPGVLLLSRGRFPEGPRTGTPRGTPRV
jgi:hypothetical protein